jgi:hypothetical protein
LVAALLVAVLLKVTERFTVAAEGAVTSRRCAETFITAQRIGPTKS